MPTTARTPSNRFRFVLVFLFGILIGAGLTVTIGDGILRSDAVDPEDAVGTFLPRNSLDRLNLVDRESFDAGALTGAVETRSGRGIVLMEVAIDSDAPGEVEVHFDENALSPRGFNQESPAGQIEYQDNRYRLVTAGTNRYQLTFRTRTDQPSTVQLRFESEGTERVIDVEVEPER